MTYLGTRQIQFEHRYFVHVPGRSFVETAEVVWRDGGVVAWWRRADGTKSAWVSRDLLVQITAYLWPGVSVPLAS